MTTNIKTVLLVAIFGVIGVLMRYFLVQLIAPKSPDFPLGTLVINLAGSFVMGALLASSSQQAWPETSWFVPLTIGFLGGLTTFSALSGESLVFLNEGRVFLGLAYLFGSPALGLICAWLGFSSGRLWLRVLS